jgi:hypothetical protein
LSIIFDLERTNQLSLLPDKDLVDLCSHIEPYQVPKSHFLVAELLRESGIVPLSIQDDLPIQGLHDSFEAAAILAQALLWQLLFVSSLLSITLPVHEYQNNS